MKRIPQIDFFRGLFLVLITTNHFLSWQNIISRFTTEFIGWVTAAEGFVFVSGLTAGIVYSRKLVEKGETFISIAAKKRTWTIYKYHLGLFILVTLLFFSHSAMKAYWFTNYADYKLLYQKPGLSVILGSFLLYQPIYMDILPMYALFILLLPVCLKYFQQGKHLIILTCSFLVYFVGTLDVVPSILELLTVMRKVDTGFFNLLSWQILFIGGLYLGYLTYQNKTGSILHNRKLFYAAVAISLLLFCGRRVYTHVDYFSIDWVYWTSKDNLGPLRLLNFAALLMVISNLAARYKRWFSFEPLCYLGKYSLEVFSLHILLIIIFKPVKEMLNDHHTIKLMDGVHFSPWATFMLLFILIPALFLAPYFKKRFTQPKVNFKAPL